MDFYDSIADAYDAVTHAVARNASARRFIDRFMERYSPTSVIDVACGQGMFTIPLAERGIRVVGADISEGMIARARHKAEGLGLRMDWIVSPMQELAGLGLGTVDAALCMGNSLPHLLTDADLEQALESFAQLLKPGGVLAVRLLNYTRILQRQERIVGIDSAGDKQYVRFYDFLDNGRIRFNVLQIFDREDSPQHAIHSTTLRPYGVEELLRRVAAAGLKTIQTCGGLDFTPFDAAESDSLLLLATRGE